MENTHKPLSFKDIVNGFTNGNPIQDPNMASHLSLWDMFLYSVKNYPNLPFLIFEPNQVWTYAQTYDKVLVMKDVLLSHGVKKDDKIVLMLPNSPYYILGFWAACALGAAVVNTNPMYAEGELDMILENSKANILITVDSPIIMPKIIKLSKKFVHVKFVLCPIDPKKGVQEKQTINLISLKAFMGCKYKLLFSLLKSKIQRNLNILFKANLTGNDMAVLQYTGGTTGVPKAVLLLHSNLVINTLQAIKEMLDFKLEPTKETVLGALPFFHIFGFTAAHLLSIAMGSRLILLHFAIPQYIEAVKKYKPTMIFGVPTMYALIARAEEAKGVDFSSVKIAVSGGASLPETVRNIVFDNLKIKNFMEGYGLSETSPIVCMSHKASESGTIGSPVMFTQVAIHDHDTEKPLKVGEIGEIWVKGPQVMKEYYNNKKETSLVFTKDGWFKTGDIGCYVNNSILKIVDRLKDMVIYKGFKIFPVLVEAALNKHSSIEESAVIGVKHADFGEVAKAFVVLKKGESIDEEQVKVFLKDHLAHYEIPAFIEQIEILPKTLIGKIDKKALKDIK